jgi:ribonuclease P protein component
MTTTFRLRKHADFQRVYKTSSKQFSKRMAFFFALREATAPGAPDVSGPRVGLTVGKVMGKAVDRNRIKRRMREAVRRRIGAIAAPVDIVLHPRRIVLQMEFVELEREVAHVFGTIRAALDKQGPTSVAKATTGAAE